MSDIERLEFSVNGEDLLSQISICHCPLCDSELSKDINSGSHDEIIKCSNEEKAKIQVNLKELEISIDELQEQLSNVTKELTLGEKKSEKYKNQIALISSRDLKPLKTVMKILIERAKISSMIDEINNTITRKKGEIITFEESKKIKEDSVTDSLVIDMQIYKDLCNVIKNSLIACGYTDVTNVTFDVKTQDIEIDGVHRLSNGKGYRAFFYAIFVASLMIYLQDVQHNFQRVLVLDSPLTTLKEWEADRASKDDFIDKSLQDGLFTFFAENFNDKQAIIMDNKQPPKSLIGKYNEISFTKDRSEERYGFFKVK